MPFTWYVTLMAILYGYIVPGIGTNIMKKWRFHGPGRVGNYYIHHGFIWAANLSPALFLSFLGTPEGPLGYGTILRVLIATGAIHAYKGWIYDIALLRHGFVEITSVPRLQGKSPEEVAGHYVPVCFFLIGLTYALAALVAYHFFVVLHRTDFWSQVWAWATGGVSMLAIPSLAYRIIEHQERVRAFRASEPPPEDT
jgi:hypothetical protein